MIIRSLRNISKGYSRHGSLLMDLTDESPPHITLETSGHGKIEMSDYFPDKIVLNAGINPIKINSDAVFTRKIGGQAKTVSMYNSPKIDPRSLIQNEFFCCAGVNISFENSGYIIDVNGGQRHFVGKNFDKYQIVMESDSLYTKDFLITEQSISECADDYGIKLPNGHAASRIIYPYGGFYQYGIHPKRIESCVCFMSRDFLMNIAPLSAISDVDPTTDTLLKSNRYFVGVKNFSPAQKQSLYSDLMKGECKFNLKYENQSQQFVSNALIWHEKTNLMQICFVQNGDSNEK